MIKLDHVSKTFGGGESEVAAVRDVTLDIAQGEIFGIIGYSGAGKSTLVRCINLLEKPTGGSILFNGEDIGGVAPAGYRAKVGMVFQQFNLFDNMTTLKNCMIGQMKVLKRSKAEARQIAEDFLEKVGMRAFAEAKPKQLSGGEQQRVALARALINQPTILLADEPTGNLDPKNSWEIMKLLEQINENGTTVIVVTHNREIVNAMQKRVVTLKRGVIVSDEEKGGYIDED